jgi:hypothetical protein
MKRPGSQNQLQPLQPHLWQLLIEVSQLQQQMQRCPKPQLLVRASHQPMQQQLARASEKSMQQQQQERV